MFQIFITCTFYNMKSFCYCTYYNIQTGIKKVLDTLFQCRQINFKFLK